MVLSSHQGTPLCSRKKNHNKIYNKIIVQLRSPSIFFSFSQRYVLLSNVLELVDSDEKKKNMKDWSLRVSVAILNMIFSSSWHLPAKFIISFSYRWIVAHWEYASHFYYPLPVEEHLVFIFYCIYRYINKCSTSEKNNTALCSSLWALREKEKLF